MSMEPIPTKVAESRLTAATVVHDVFCAMFPSKSPQGSNVATRASQGLEASRWASRDVVMQHARPVSRGLADSMWAPKGSNQKGLQEKVS